MRISLVVATVGRTVELKRLLASLEAQTHRDFDVIVVDQNPDARVAPILTDFARRLEIRHLMLTSAPGASRARNVGLRHVTGEVVCFPDDDCWYPEDFLHRLDALMTTHPGWDAVIGDVVDESGRPILPWRDRPGTVTRPICWRRALCAACIVRARVLQTIGGFDETMGGGAGTPWGCGEDNDLMLRAIERGFHVQYDETLRIHHPRLYGSFDDASRVKRYRYSLGEGGLLRKHPMPMWWRALFFGMPVGRMIVAMLKLAGDETRFHWTTCVGRLRGFRLSA
jgi:glycosyltransferase involved in cell wall biosynthesis